MLLKLQKIDVRIKKLENLYSFKIKRPRLIVIKFRMKHDFVLVHSRINFFLNHNFIKLKAFIHFGQIQYQRSLINILYLCTVLGQ